MTSEKIAYSSETLPLPKEEDLLLHTYMCVCVINVCVYAEI